MGPCAYYLHPYSSKELGSFSFVAKMNIPPLYTQTFPSSFCIYFPQNYPYSFVNLFSSFFLFFVLYFQQTKEKICIEKKKKKKKKKVVYKKGKKKKKNLIYILHVSKAGLKVQYL